MCEGILFQPLQNSEFAAGFAKVEIKKKETKMLKIRLKRLGAKKAPTYRVIVINSTKEGFLFF